MISEGIRFARRDVQAECDSCPRLQTTCERRMLFRKPDSDRLSIFSVCCRASWAGWRVPVMDTVGLSWRLASLGMDLCLFFLGNMMGWWMYVLVVWGVTFITLDAGWWYRLKQCIKCLSQLLWKWSWVFSVCWRSRTHDYTFEFIASCLTCIK